MKGISVLNLKTSKCLIKHHAVGRLVLWGIAFTSPNIFNLDTSLEVNDYFHATVTSVVLICRTDFLT
jgi:hypothetical protein